MLLSLISLWCDIPSQVAAIFGQEGCVDVLPRRALKDHVPHFLLLFSQVVAASRHQAGRVRECATVACRTQESCSTLSTSVHLSQVVAANSGQEGT